VSGANARGEEAVTAAGGVVSAARAARDRVRRWRFDRRLAAPRLLRAFADENPGASFVEIGANDGEQHDHLRPFILEREWTGVMVEPVPYVFERLRRNYAGVERVALENAAVGERDGELPFFYLVDAPEEERARLPDWYDGIGSFSREAVLTHAAQIPDVEERLVSALVPTLTFQSLCERNGLERVDLLVIDTEGHDFEVLKGVDLERWRPQLVVYEHYHLSREDRVDCADLLRGHGYDTIEEGFDTLCLHAAVAGRLRATWDGLRPAVPGLAKYEELT
jgi:FkbM family methyltransferase